MTGDMYNPRLPADQSLGIDGTPAWAYDEDGYCVCCGNGRWKFHMPDCELADALDMADPVAVIRARVESGTIKGKQRRYCEAHDSMAITPGYRCDHFRLLRATNNEGSPCRMIQTLVIPVSDGGEDRPPL